MGLETLNSFQFESKFITQIAHLPLFKIKEISLDVNTDDEFEINEDELDKLIDEELENQFHENK
jgi:hypothetical protein